MQTRRNPQYLGPNTRYSPISSVRLLSGLYIIQISNQWVHEERFLRAWARIADSEVCRTQPKRMHRSIMFRQFVSHRALAPAVRLTFAAHISSPPIKVKKPPKTLIAFTFWRLAARWCDCGARKALKPSERAPKKKHTQSETSLAQDKGNSRSVPAAQTARSKMC